MASERYILVVAIDFGTTFSGYAFSFKTDPNNINMNKSWGASLGFQSYKTPTTVHVDPSGELKGFGFEAEEEYSNMEEEEVTPDQFSLYKKFKMMLHGQKITERFLLHSTNGNIRPAVDIFSMALGYLKRHVIQTIGQQLERAPSNQDIRWVLTVPAIWGDAAKQFMRKAAKKAGLIDEVDSKQLLIALEPEAASLHCRTLEMKQFEGMETKKGKLNLDANTKYMIIDVGGGTIDITVHQTLPNGTVREVYKATGGPWGGSYVDEMYENLLCDIFGRAFIQDYKVRCSHQWLNMMIEFEKRKRAAKPGNKSSTNLPLHMGFARQFEKFTKKDFESVFRATTSSGVKFSSSGMLCISSQKMAHLFDGVLHSIELHLRDLLQQEAVSGVKHIFLVGGFGESTYLKEMVSQKFGQGRTILIPEEASMSVLKGAVLYGHRPSDITSRVSKFTYAICRYRDFIEGQDLEERKRVIEGVGKKIYTLKTLVKAGEELPMETVCSTIVHPLEPDQKVASVSLYNSRDILDDKKTQSQDGNVFRMANVSVSSPNTSKGQQRDIRVSMTFGGTEIYFSAVDLDSGNDAGTNVNFES